jgi:PEP-CTERM motif
MMNRLFSTLTSHRTLAITFAIAAMGVSSATASPLTFAQYFQLNGAAQQWTISTSGGMTTVQAGGTVSFNFSGVSGLPFAGPENAIFSLFATSTTPGNCGSTCGSGDSFNQQGYTGSFSFIDNGGGAAQGKNLLSGTFSVNGTPATSGAQFSSTVGGNGGSFNASSTAGNLNQVVFTSAYLDFTNQTQETSSWSLSSLIPNFSTGPVTVVGTTDTAFPSAGPFGASGSGTFSSNPGPTSSVPEPASMGLLGGGLILLGSFRFKRRT